MRRQGECDGRARDPDVAGGERQDPGEVERRDDQECGDEWAFDAECGCDTGRRSEPQRHRETDPAGEPCGGARAAAEDAERVEHVCDAAARPRRAHFPGDGDRDEDAEQQCGDRPARQNAARRSERQHDREPERPHGAERRCNAADRPQAALAGQDTREEREADRRPDPRRRQRVHERAGAVARCRIGWSRRAAAARQRRRPAARRGDQRRRERRCGDPQQHRRSVTEPVDARGDPVAEQLRRRRQHEQHADRAEEERNMTLVKRRWSRIARTR